MITLKSEQLINIKNLNLFLEEEVTKQEVDKTSCFAYWGNAPIIENSFPSLRLVESQYFGYGDETTPLGLIYSYKDNIYYNNIQQNNVSKLLESEWTPSQDEISEAEQAIEMISKYCISKYNQHPVFSLNLEEEKHNKKRILLIDQPINSESVALSGANSENFEKMFLYVFENHTDATIYIKYHPDTINVFQEGFLQRFLKKNKLMDHPAIEVIDYHCNMASIFYYMDDIYTVTSSAGFEASIRGKNVFTFGNSFYSGYGFTSDMISVSKKERAAIDVFIALFLRNGLYLNPFNLKKGKLLDILEYISLQLRHRNSNEVLFFRSNMISKSNGVANLLNIPNEKNTCLSNKANLILEKEKLILADNSISLGQIPKANKKAFVYNGFLFSSNQNKDTCPISLILDHQNAYYNSKEVAEIDEILNAEIFTSYELKQAEILIEKINERFNFDLENHKAKDLSKYKIDNKKIILIPSIEDNNFYNYETSITSDLELIYEVSKREKNCVIIYKAKDKQVEKQNKINKQIFETNNNLFFVDTENHISHCLNIAQEIHLVNHNIGLEALILNKKVLTYGYSFYSGRGLTNDIFNYSKNKKKLNLKELVAGSLMLYPRYKKPNNPNFISAIAALDYYLENYLENIKPVNNSLFKKIINTILHG